VIRHPAGADPGDQRGGLEDADHAGVAEGQSVDLAVLVKRCAFVAGRLFGAAPQTLCGKQDRAASLCL
jgi:hypothetical protein